MNRCPLTLADVERERDERIVDEFIGSAVTGGRCLDADEMRRAREHLRGLLARRRGPTTHAEVVSCLEGALRRAFKTRTKRRGLA
jgi:hypothetical protein